MGLLQKNGNQPQSEWVFEVFRWDGKSDVEVTNGEINSLPNYSSSTLDVIRNENGHFQWALLGE